LAASRFRRRSRKEATFGVLARRASEV
jgi:hypothetical protein